MSISKYRTRYTKIISILMAWVFLFSSTPLPAVENVRNSFLAPSASTPDPEFRAKFLLQESILSHPAENAYIKRQIERLVSVRDGKWLQECVDRGIIPIPGLLKKTGQFAHLGLGRQYGRQMIYMDADIYNDTNDKKSVLDHEDGEASQWDELMQALGKKPGEMRGWIIAHINSPDPALDTIKKYAGKSSRKLAEEFHKQSPSIDALYKKYADVIDINESYLRQLLTRYNYPPDEPVFYDAADSKDVNIRAGLAAASMAPPGRTWIEENVPGLARASLLTVSLEGIIAEFDDYPDAQSACGIGGLGAHFDDKSFGLDAIGMKASMAQPGYMVSRNGNLVDYDALVKAGVLKPVTEVDVWSGLEDPVLGSIVNRSSVKFRYEDWINGVADINVSVKVKVYEIVRRGTTRKFLFVSPLFDILYTDNRLHRFMQETALGKVIDISIKKGNIPQPDIVHLNEGHVAPTVSELRTDRDLNLMATATTNHTVVDAGNERYSPASLGIDADRMAYLMGEGGSKFRGAYSANDGGGLVFDFSHASIEMTDITNGVSAEHAGVLERRTASIVKAKARNDMKINIVPVLNGSGPTWVMKELLDMRAKGHVPTKEELWSINQRGKEEALAEVKKRTNVELDPDKPTLWLVRRMVEYKSQYPVLRFLVHLICADKDKTFTRDHLKAIWDEEILKYAGGLGDREWGRVYNRDINKKIGIILDELFKEKEVIHGLGMQIVVGGASYEDHWVYEFTRWMGLPALKGRFVYVPNSDKRLLKMQAIGSDICAEIPRDLDEACGTSGQRRALNGGVTIGINGAGPAELVTDYTPKEEELMGPGSGFLLGPYTDKDESGVPKRNLDRFYSRIPADLFGKLARASEEFYADKSGQDKWKERGLRAYLAATYGEFKNSKGERVRTNAVTATAMEQRYARNVYLPALRIAAQRHAHDYAKKAPPEHIEVMLDMPTMLTMQDTLKLLSLEPVLPNLENGMLYEVRYNKDRLQGSPGAIDVVEEYVKLLRLRASDPRNIRLIPTGAQDCSLVSIRSYKDDKLFGDGTVNVKDRDIVNLRIVDILNISFAAANIQTGKAYEDMDPNEHRLIVFIQDICESLTGVRVAPDKVLDFIKRLVRIIPLSINDVAEYNRIMLRKLKEAV